MNFIKAVSAVNDYNWEDECKNWEEETDKEYEPNKCEPKKNSNHIFRHLVQVENFMQREISIYGKKTTIYKLLKNLTDDELAELLEQVGCSIAHSKGLKL